MTSKTRVLLIDDDENSFVLTGNLFAEIKHGRYHLDWVDTYEEGLEAIQQSSHDVYLVDYRVGPHDGMKLLDEAMVTGCRAPIIMLTSQGEHALDVQAMRAGAADFVPKDKINVTGLERSVRHALDRQNLINALAERAEQLTHTNAQLQGEIRERRRAEDALRDSEARHREMAAAADRTNKAKSDFLSTASHELRAPLTIIREYISLVRDGGFGATNQKQSQFLESALKNCDRLGALINNLLDLQRIESGGQRLRRRRVDIGRLAIECTRDFLTTCRKKQQHIDINVGRSVPDALCDRGAVAQILTNLIGNAHKFTPNGGHIGISVYVDSSADKFVRISVADTGVGISKEDQERVFAKFVRVDRPDGTCAKGTGLGLAIARSLAASHDGAITISSKPGEGTIFVLSIPIYSEERALAALLKDNSACAMAAGKELLVTLLKPAATNGCYAEELRTIKRCVDKALRRKEDSVLIVESERMVVVANEADETERPIFARQLEQALTRELGTRLPVATVSGIFGEGDDIETWLTDARRSFARYGNRILDRPRR